MEQLAEKIKEKADYCLGCKVKMCQKGCPLDNDIPSFIKFVKENNYGEAYKILTKTTVLGGICGRICPHFKQCRGNCVRGIKGEPVDIGTLEAKVWDETPIKDFDILGTSLKGKKVAIIGGGPAGLTCSAFLARNSADVTIYEKHSKLGGILRYGIPEFRLNRDVLEDCIQRIINLGINVKNNLELGKDYVLEELEKEYDAIFLSFGANISSKMNIEGENLNGVYGGNELLELGNHPNYIGKKVAVIGGGNVAMDAARTIKKLGAKEVKIIYRRAEKQMPAEIQEIEDAKKEGIEFLFQNNIVKILGNENKEVTKIECIKTELVKKEGETREVPIDIIGSNYLIDMDYVVMAIGSKAEKDLVNSLILETTNWGYIKIDENYMTSRNKVFAGGDLAGTKATVAWAARSGREAANAIMNFLNTHSY